jgi:hypothetical protein
MKPQEILQKAVQKALNNDFKLWKNAEHHYIIQIAPCLNFNLMDGMN